MNNKDIYIIYGCTPKSMVNEILNYIHIEDDIKKDACIGIKPNLVVAKPSNSGATTSPELVAGVIEYLQSKGFNNIVILEGSWVGERTSRAFKACGYEELSKRYGIPLIDLQNDSYTEYKINNMKINICKKVMELDYLINMPVLKGHCQTNMTCALKNMKGCIPDFEKRRFHTLGLHKPIAYLNKLIKQNLVIVDGIMGDLNFEEGGNPVRMNRIFVGKDPVLIDTYAAQLMGFKFDDVQYIKMAEMTGVGSTDISNAAVFELNNDKDSVKIKPSGKAQLMSKYICENNACSACYGSLIHALQRLNECGLLRNLNSKLYIGQDYKGKSCEGIGIGSCTSGFERFVAGCPPKAKDIIEYFESNNV